MPQAATDNGIPTGIFLWPGHGYGTEISLGKPPRQVLGNLYVRTTKKELGPTKGKASFHRRENGTGATGPCIQSFATSFCANIRGADQKR